MKQGIHELHPLYLQAMRLLVLSALAAILTEAQQDSCTSGRHAKSSALLQMHSKEVATLSRARAASQAPVHPDVQRWSQTFSFVRHTGGYTGFTGARRRRGESTDKDAAYGTSHNHHAHDAGIKVAKEQMESVQDGIVALKAVDRDMVDSTMKEMSDMQRYAIQLVAALLCGNILAILSVCLCQVYPQKHRDSTANEPQMVPLTPGLAAAQILLGAAAVEDSRSLRSGSVTTGMKPSGSTASCGPLDRAAPDHTTAGPLDSALGPIVPGSWASSGSPRAAMALKTRQQKTEMRKLDKDHDDRTSSASPEQRGPLRTVDAFCTPGRSRENSVTA